MPRFIPWRSDARALSAEQLLCESGIVGVSLHKVMKELEEEAEKAREQDSIFSLRFQRLM